MSRFSFRDWPLSAKWAAVLLVASAVPLTAAVALLYGQARAIIESDAAALLGARADALATSLDSSHLVYQARVAQLSRDRSREQFCADEDPAMREEVAANLRAKVAGDPNLVGVELIDLQGRVIASADDYATGATRANRAFFARAASGKSAISDIFFLQRTGDSLPVIAYAAPLYRNAEQVVCVATMYVRAEAFWSEVRAANGVAGEGSYAIVLDEFGVRIAHSFREDQVFHPAGVLPEAEFTRMVGAGTFDDPTLARLQAPVLVPEQFDRARAPDLAGLDGVYHYLAPANETWNLSVARRLSTVPWTVFFQVPVASVSTSADALTRDAVVVGLAVVIVGIGAGLVLVRQLNVPLQELSAAAAAMALGETSSRVVVRGGDEIGQLGERFNAMASALETSRQGLEARVRERTIELERANEELRAQRRELVAQSEELLAQQRELALKNEEVQRADKLKSEFLANMSHELRTPLNAVIGFSELLGEEADLSARHRQFLADVLGSGRHLLHLINEILDLAKVEAGRTSLEFTTLDPAACIHDAALLLGPVARTRRITVVERSTATHLVRADAARLKQVLLNLLSNAVKFSPEESTVEVGSIDAPGSVRFYVRDRGPGIDDALRQRLFQPFVQGENPLVKHHEGTGLGLAISRRLVEQHGGTIDVLSRPGDGATFWFSIPEADSSTLPSPAAALPRLATARVLLLDDTPERAERLVETLEGGGYDVVRSTTLEDAAARTEELHPRAIVLDPDLRDSDGILVLDRLGRDPRTAAVPVVVSVAPSARGYLPKPVEAPRLLESVARALRVAAPSPRVLIIDDDPRSILLVRSVLEPEGYVVEGVSSGKEGLARACSLLPDVLVVDLLLPDISGFEIVDRLATDSATRAIPIIVLTAMDLEDTDRARLRTRVLALAEKGDTGREALLAALARAVGWAPRAPDAEAPLVLVVDDHDLNRELARSMLEGRGYRVALASDGAEAVEACLRQPPALVLMDLAMPVMDGFAATRALKENPATQHIPVVALTALAMRGDEERARAAGVTGYLTKPIERQALDDVLTRTIHRGARA